ncbi:MAG: molybdopterin biosynthesis protein MoeB [Betaproteobacteria bacterium]|nr:MAG: molybdopterin biosynthesis protein MoeB [Betaproteobacteria bacterium]
MTDEQLLRYSRHILLDELGVEGQQRLTASHALVIGAGGLGSPVALYLGTAGVGTITLIDHDTVDLTNLQRQIAIQERADAARLDVLVEQADVVIDCSDNFATRHAVNAACVAHAKPLVSGAAIGFDGQVSVYDTRDAANPCYACLFPPDAAFEETRCATMGVFAPLVGIIGTIQAAEALKLLAGVGSSLAGRLQMVDARSMEWTEIRLARQAGCAVCGAR